MKKILQPILLSALIILFFASCYSPKQKVEKDKHPDIPEFPEFKDGKVKLEKVSELTLAFEGNQFGVLGNKVFVYSGGVTEMDGSAIDAANFLMVLENGKRKQVAKWEQDTEYLPVFFSPKGDLFVGNQKFIAPSYKKRVTVPVYSMEKLSEKFFYGSIQPETTELGEKLRAEQEKVLSKVKSIYEVDRENYYSGLFKEPRQNTYLCNERSTPFFIRGEYFEDYNLDKKNQPKSIADKKYVDKFRPVVKDVNEMYKFNSEFTFSNNVLKETEAIVIGNKWFSHGNHYVGSAGYSQQYLRYYSLKIGEELAETKVSENKMTFPDVIKTATGYYFMVFDAKQEKMTIYFLRL